MKTGQWENAKISSQSNSENVHEMGGKDDTDVQSTRRKRRNINGPSNNAKHLPPLTGSWNVQDKVPIQRSWWRDEVTGAAFECNHGMCTSQERRQSGNVGANPALDT